jgi:hypothetical protein
MILFRSLDIARNSLITPIISWCSFAPSVCLSSNIDRTSRRRFLAGTGALPLRFDAGVLDGVLLADGVLVDVVLVDGVLVDGASADGASPLGPGCGS